tara:strand:- start:1536 stop:2192 length:657 start_codon:yes stop_codon:yes gene_type:complete
MGQNSQEVAYGFGQLGSAYTDIAQTIVPPQGMVICAIQFLADNTPTVLTPEKLDKTGPGFPEITGGTNVTALASTTTRNTNGYFMGAVDDTSSSTTATLSTTGIENVKVGSYVLLVNDDYQEDGAPAMTIDSETPVPIYSGPNKQGVYVVSRDADGGDEMVLSSAVSPSSQALIFLDAEHGAGAIISNGQVYPKGVVIYGRWTEFKPSASGVICYFGK